MQQITFRAMNCQMMACLDHETPRTARRLAEVPVWFESWEQRLSRFRPDSELSRINRRSQASVAVSDVMADVLRAARFSLRESDGLVSPLVLPALEAAGYDRSFEQIDRLQEQAVLFSSPPSGDSSPGFRLNPHRRLLDLPPGSRLDLGGVAKGWAADRSARRLGKLAPALVDAGGDIAVSGPQASGLPWPIGINHPLEPEQSLDIVLLSHGGVATSGRDYRRWQNGKALQHHIIDPRSNRPAVTDVLTATVVAPSTRAAEAAAKTALILGSWQGLNWLEARPHLAGLLVLENGDVFYTPNWISYIWRKTDEPSLIIST